jgi:hypothetical protein
MKGWSGWVHGKPEMVSCVSVDAEPSPAGDQQFAAANRSLSPPDSFLPLCNGLTMRQAEVSRNTLETRITVRLNLDGNGRGSFATGVPSSTTCSTRFPAMA